MEIIAYTYDGDYHCIDCTAVGVELRHHSSLAVDEHGIGIGVWADIEGNLVHPLFSTDEWQELDESFLAENPTQYLACVDCLVIIDTYTKEKESAEVMGAVGRYIFSWS